MQLFNRKKGKEEPKANVFWEALNQDNRILQNCGSTWCDSDEQITHLIVELATRFFQPGDTIWIGYGEREVRIEKPNNDFVLSGMRVSIEKPNDLLRNGYLPREIYSDKFTLQYEQLPLLLKKMEYWTYSEFCNEMKISRDFISVNTLQAIESVHVVIPKDASLWGDDVKGRPEHERYIAAFNSGIRYLMKNPDVYEFEFGKNEKN